MTDETPHPLTEAEVAELDTYGELSGIDLLLGMLAPRAVELWERELLWGREKPDPRGFSLLPAQTGRGTATNRVPLSPEEAKAKIRKATITCSLRLREDLREMQPKLEREVRRAIKLLAEEQLRTAMLGATLSTTIKANTTTAAPAPPLTLDSIMATMDALAQIPPPPFLGSSVVFPAGRAMRFAYKGRDHWLAHPSFWQEAFLQLPAQDTRTANPWAGLEVVDLDAKHREDLRNELLKRAFLQGNISGTNGEDEQRQSHERNAVTAENPDIDGAISPFPMVLPDPGRASGDELEALVSAMEADWIRARDERAARLRSDTAAVEVVVDRWAGLGADKYFISSNAWSRIMRHDLSKRRFRRERAKLRAKRRE